MKFFKGLLPKVLIVVIILWIIGMAFNRGKMFSVLPNDDPPRAKKVFKVTPRN